MGASLTEGRGWDQKWVTFICMLWCTFQGHRIKILCTCYFDKDWSQCRQTWHSASVPWDWGMFKNLGQIGWSMYWQISKLESWTLLQYYTTTRAVVSHEIGIFGPIFKVTLCIHSIGHLFPDDNFKPVHWIFPKITKKTTNIQYH